MTQDFLNIFDMTLNAQARAETAKWEYINLKKFCVSKDTVNRVQREPIEWEETSRMYRELLRLSNSDNLV